MEHRSTELNEIRQRALGYLCDATTVPSAPPLIGYSLQFRLWWYPAFKPHKSWSVFESKLRHEPTRCLVRQVIWDSPQDSCRLSNPMTGLRDGFHTHPKIELRDRTLDASMLETRLNAGRQIPVSMVRCDQVIFLDGESLGYEERNGSTRLEWHGNGPTEWREFIHWAREMMTWLQEVCAS